MHFKCERVQMECEERMAMQDPNQKEMECEYKCCEGDLCNTDPCNLGLSIHPPSTSIAGIVFAALNVITFCL